MAEQFNGILVLPLVNQGSIIPMKASELYKAMGTNTVVFLAFNNDAMNLRNMWLLSSSSIGRDGSYTFTGNDNTSYIAANGDAFPVIE